MPIPEPATKHDQQAPFWATGLAVLCMIGLATNWIDLGAFWKGHVLDMTGPAWTYILLRGRFTAKADNAWTRIFTPSTTATLLIVACFGIEGAQYLGLYDSTFDPWDLLAYVSILGPLFVLDLMTSEPQGRTDSEV